MIINKLKFICAIGAVFYASPLQRLRKKTSKQLRKRPQELSRELSEENLPM